MSRQAFDYSAALDSANSRAPLIERECVRYSLRKRIGRITPKIFARLGAIHIFAVVETIHGYSIRTIRQAHEHVWQCESYVARILALTERIPLHKFSRFKCLREIARERQLVEAIHIEQPWACGSNKGCVRRGRDSGHLLQRGHILRMPPEFEIAHEHAERVTAESSVFVLIDALEHHALVEFRRFLHIVQEF